MKYTLQIQFPFQQNKVVYALETFDPLVVRCGIPHFLLCKYISSNTNVKVLLSGKLFGKSYFPKNVPHSGEGADELFGSYAYMQKAPSAPFLQQEIHRRLFLLHQYDVLRCDRSVFFL
jgi:asparagine synthase (glutamine-hydrolysing)